MFWFLLAANASADDCEWPEVDKVFSTMTTLSINGDMRSVEGKTNRVSMENDLRTCGYDQAANELRQWRSMRRATNWTAGLGLIVVWPALIATPFTAMSAGDHRSQLENVLRDAKADEE